MFRSQLKLFIGLMVSILGVASANATKTLIYCSEASPSTFNPQMGSDGPTFNASSRAIYNRLADFKAGTTEVVPSLAESWTISDGGKVYTFKLRKGVKFHTTKYFTPTREFNADDVVFSFERMLKVSHPYNKVNGGVYEYFKSMELDTLIKEVVKVDEQTVKFILAKAEAPFLVDMAMDFASILSAEYGQKLLANKTPEKIDFEPIGTGPFVFQSYSKDTQIRYEANANYFAGRAAIDKLVFAITKDASVRTQKLKAGECHLIAEPQPSDLGAMKKDPKLLVLEQEGLNVGYLAFNTQKAPFDKLEVRQAIHMALNRAAYLEAVYLGFASIAKNPLPPSLWGYNKSIKDYEYNVEKAKALLKKAGFEKGFETTLWYLPVSRPYNPAAKKMAEMMQADLAKIGIKLNLVTFEWATYLAKARKGEHEMLLAGWTADIGDPDNFMNTLLGCAAVESGSNYSRWCDKAYDKLMEQAKTTNDIKKRTKFYEEAQRIFKEQAPWVTLAHAKVFRAMAKNVTGFKISPLGTDSFYGVDLK